MRVDDGVQQDNVRRYLEETRTQILPYAERINANMFRELSDLLDSRERSLPATTTAAASPFKRVN